MTRGTEAAIGVFSLAGEHSLLNLEAPMDSRNFPMKPSLLLLAAAAAVAVLDRMSLSNARRLALDVMTRVARAGRAEPHTRRASHEAS